MRTGEKMGSVKPPRLAVVRHTPWRRALIVTLSAFIGLVCLIIGFALGSNEWLNQRISNQRLEQDLASARSEALALQGALVDANLELDVGRDAATALRKDLQQRHGEIVRLREEVTFYKSLMAPGDVVEGLQIAELELRPQRKSRLRYKFALLLTQVALRRNVIRGELRMDVVGTQADGQEVVHSLTDLQEQGDYPLRFRFRYFQDMQGELELPEGFVPRSVLVTAQQKGKDTTQVTFPWPQELTGNA